MLLSEHERRQIHRRLAQAIEARGFDDPEALYEDYLGAGEQARAAFHAESAARKAASALAFDRAALYYRKAIEHAPAKTSITELRIALADALANAGRSADAAEEFLEAAKETSARRSLELRERAAAQLLMGGHVEEGLEVFHGAARGRIQIAESAEASAAESGPARADCCGCADWSSPSVKLRHCGSDLHRIDVCWSVAAGLGIVI
jgi:hypothetical protein